MHDGELSATVEAAVDLLDGKTCLSDEVTRGTVSFEGLSRRRLRDLFGFRIA